MKLFSYQENALLAIDSDPSHSQLISMPTGTGKTVTFLTHCLRKGKKTLILVHRNELLDQTLEKALKVGFKESEISIITSSDKQSLNRLSIAMVPTLIRNIEKYVPDDVEMIIVDEAHHAKANSYLKIFEYFNIFSEQKKLLGFTATPLRGDKKELSDVFLSHSFKMTLSEATQNGYICPVNGIRFDIQRSLEELELSKGDYDISQLDKIMNCDSINNLIADKLQHLPHIPSIIFCTSVDHAKKISKLLRERKRKAISVSYETPKKVLSKIFDLLRKGKIEFITNAVKLSEGFDFPPIQSIILARPTRSPVLYKQMIGRGLRKSENKLECFVLEFSGSDSKMICWEDIDENCTFQSESAVDKRSREQALHSYKNTFSSDKVKVLDVRISPFKFYECKIRRMFSFKKVFRSIPFEAGFIVNHFTRMKKPKKTDVYGFTNISYSCFWKEKYKTFYIWDAGKLWETECGWQFEELERQCLFYADHGFTGDKGLSKWYPSEEEKMTQLQRSYLINPEKMSARKAEMFIEECAIKKAIQLYWIDEQMPQIIEGNEYSVQANHNTKIYTLPGRY